jgi:ComF family protein
MSLRNLFRQTTDAALSMLFPTACRVCGAMIESWRDGVACRACWDEMKPIEPSCTKCGLLLRPLPLHIQIEDRRCGLCENFAFHYARACGPYQGALHESVLWLKSTPQIAPRLCDLLLKTFESLNEIEPVESLVPVPLHPSRQRERTFNQAEIIARALAGRTDLRVDPASLVRVKRTEMHRAGMGAIERARSLDKAFRVRARRLIENRAVMVVDDVMTTGSTADGVSRTLMEAGAKSVSILTLARATNEFTQ